MDPSEENWFKSSLHLVNYLKLRTSYGSTGNDQIGDYSFYNLYNTILTPNPYQGIVTIGVNGPTNPYIRWEETRKFNMGLEIGMFKNRVLANIGYVKNRSGNQIISYVLPSTTGSNSVLRNFPGIIQNTAFEATLSTINIRKKDISWSTNLNISVPRNKLIRFDNLESTSYRNRFKIGEPISVVRLFRFAGVNTETGLYEFYTADGSKTSTPKGNIDDVKYKNIAPTMTGGIQNTFNYKGFQLDFFLQYTQQVKSDVAIVGGGSSPGGPFNILDIILSRWQNKGDVTNVQKVANASQLLNQNLAAQTSDLVYRDASFLRLKNVNISYSFPVDWLAKLKVRQAKVYVYGENLWTWTGYKGLDPDVSSSGIVMPSLLTVVAGVNFSF